MVVHKSVLDMKYNYLILIFMQVLAILMIFLLLESYLGYVSLFVAIGYAVLAYVPMIMESTK